MTTTKDCSNERMRFLLYETNEIPPQTLWSSTDEPEAKRQFNPISSTPYLVERLRLSSDGQLIFRILGSVTCD